MMTANGTFTHANEKLPTFWTAATALPLIVMFVSGVLASVAWPDHCIAKMASYPPTQLQLPQKG